MNITVRVCVRQFSLQVGPHSLKAWGIYLDGYFGDWNRSLKLLNYEQLEEEHFCLPMVFRHVPENLRVFLPSPHEMELGGDKNWHWEGEREIKIVLPVVRGA